MFNKLIKRVMSKFIVNGVKKGSEESVEALAKTNQPIYKAKLEAKIKAQEAVIMEKEVTVEQCKNDVELAYGYSHDFDQWLEGCFDSVDLLTEAEEDLENAKTTLKELNSVLKGFE